MSNQARRSSKKYYKVIDMNKNIDQEVKILHEHIRVRVRRYLRFINIGMIEADHVEFAALCKLERTYKMLKKLNAKIMKELFAEDVDNGDGTQIYACVIATLCNWRQEHGLDWESY